MVFDGIRDKIDDAVDSGGDKLADATGKEQRGFEPSVCNGCPHRGSGALRRCGLCGCPTLPNFPMDQTGMVPKDCPRKRQHGEESDR